MNPPIPDLLRRAASYGLSCPATMTTSAATDWNRFVAATRARLRRVARSVLRDEHEAEDAIQDALLAAWKGTDRLRDPGAAEGWMIRVARNVAVSRLRSFVRSRRVPSFADAGFDPLGSEIADRRELAPETRLDLQDALADGSPILRRTVRHLLRGLSLGEIAAKERVSVGAAKTRRTRARAHVRRTLAEQIRG